MEAAGRALGMQTVILRASKKRGHRPLATVLFEDANRQTAPLTPQQQYGVTLALHPNAPERKPADGPESTNWGPVLGLRSFY